MGGTKFIPWLIAAAASLAATASAAQEPLPVDRWVGQCASIEGQPLTLQRVLPGLAVVGVGSHAIELTIPPRQAFVVENGVGLSPVGEYPEWAKAPQKLHAGLSALMRCSQTLGDPVLAGITLVSSSPSTRQTSNNPWRLLVGLLFAAFALAPVLRRGRLHVLDLVAVALVPLTLLFRLLLVPVAYLHQNGQGPLWVSYALGEPSAYGPGFRQLHRALLSRVDDPDGTLFLVHAVTGALVPFLLYVVARAANAGRLASLAVAVAVAASPALARAAQSEHYFATLIVLLTVAGALLAATASPEAGWRRFRLGIVAAGFVVAQAALVHPIGWLPAALLPLCAFFVPGDLTSRLARAAAAGVGVAAVVALTTGPQLFDILHGEVASQWLSPGTTSMRSFGPRWLILAALSLAAGFLFPRLRRSAGPVAVALLAFGLYQSSSAVFLQSTPSIRAAYGFLFVPVLASAIAAAFAPLRSRSSAIVAVLALALTLGVHARSWSTLTELPTDVLETKLALEWRELVPRGSRVIAVERARGFVLTLPLRPPHYQRGTLQVPNDDDETDSPWLADDGFYYRGALCSTEAAREYCERIERTHRLEKIWSATLPARPSLHHLEFDRPEVEVALFRVLGKVDEREEALDEDSGGPPAAAIE